MSQSRIIITGYSNPDLDGTASAIAYAELLKKQGKNTTAALFGIPHREAEFVFKTFNIDKPAQAENILNQEDKLILVDASDLRGISNLIDLKQVIEVIDHRKVNQADKFPNAKIQIELVGSCATLIAEKFFTKKIIITSSSAALLYSAIISNTVNFQANVTTERDKKMCNWLVGQFDLPKDYVHKMFVAKSVFGKPLKKVFSDDFATFEFRSKLLGIAQLEIVNTDDFINKNKDEIQKILTEIKEERNLDLIFLSVINLEKIKNTFIVIDESSKKLLEQALNVRFENNISHQEGIMMRKTIVPMVKELLISNMHNYAKETVNKQQLKDDVSK
ncbi:DHH family phosphoesterase [Patescibacteria group bacterium]|nr:DHH family phosphoesterase [Patescibacteria group bacterium]